MIFTSNCIKVLFDGHDGSDSAASHVLQNLKPQMEKATLANRGSCRPKVLVVQVATIQNLIVDGIFFPISLQWGFPIVKLSGGV